MLPLRSRINHSRDEKLTTSLEQNLRRFQEVFQNDMDFSIRRFLVFGKYQGAILTITSLVDKTLIDQDVLKPLLEEDDIGASSDHVIEYIADTVLYHGDVIKEKVISEMMSAILRGATLLLIDGQENGLLIDTFSPEKRGIQQPETERVVRGPRDGFIEQLSSNVALLRYRLPVPEFRVEQFEVGERTRSKVSICFLEDIVNPDLVIEVKTRIQSIKIDRILDAGNLEQFIQDNPRSPFPQVQNTERPDKAVGNILEGRVVILVDGSPFALIVPAVFNQFYQTSEDYNERWMITSTIRLVRMIALLFSLTFSSFYVTVLSFHPEMIPAKFVVAAASGRAGVPFPVFIEVLLMEGAMEILREATVRMPQQVGGALSIVGVLVVGQAAVQAGFVSPITVVIIALSTIGSFATPSYNAATAFRLLRFPLIILAGSFGLLGLAVGIIFTLNHMLSLRSFGIPYMAPISPGSIDGMKDTFIRAPLRWLRNRPNQLQPQDSLRIDSSSSKPNKPKDAFQNGKLGGNQDE